MGETAFQSLRLEDTDKGMRGMQETSEQGEEGAGAAAVSSPCQRPA